MIQKVLVAAGVAFVLGSSGVGIAHASGNREVYRQLEVFGEVFDRVRTDYVEPVNEEQLIESALNGMLTSLDPHSSYLNPKAAKDALSNTKGEFGGLGIEVTMDNNWVKVVSPIDDTPAARAGLLPGDFVTHIDGEPVAGLTLSDAVDKMRGAPNTDIKLTIRREGKEPFDVTLTRAIIQIKTVRSHAEGNIGYVRITQFTESTDSDLRKHIKQLKRDIGKNLTGFVIDLRNNPGGLLKQAVAVSDDFLEQGEIVSTRPRNPEEIERYNATPGDITDGLPLVVLINDGSASASEIVAGALQDHHRATVLGTRSFGKGSVQTLMDVRSSGGLLRLTTARYYTPSGRSIQAVGVEPNVMVLPSKDATEAEMARMLHEDALPNALPNPNAPKGKSTPKPAAKPEAKHKDKDGAVVEPKPIKFGDPAEDYQLARALELLRGNPADRPTGTPPAKP